jgi:PAT family beta-lactamase induction signal transducer AmpG
MASRIGWQNTYFVMSAIIAAGMLVTLLAQEPEVSKTIKTTHRRSAAQWIKESVIEPFADFIKHDSWILILVFIVIYKLADAFIGIMTNPFYLDIGFTKDDIATYVKLYGTIATIIGTFLGGVLVTRYGAIRILFLAGFMHALTNLLYVVQAYVGVDTTVLAASVAMENLTGGISAAAFVAYLSSLCNVHYTATQYALLSSLAAFGRTVFSTPAGYAAKTLGWEMFFILSALLAIPGLVLLWVLNKRLKATSLPVAET